MDTKEEEEEEEKERKKRERSVAGMPSAKSRKIFYTWAWHKRCRERWQGHFDIEDVYAPISGAVNFNPCDGLSAFPPPQPLPSCLATRSSAGCPMTGCFLIKPVYLQRRRIFEIRGTGPIIRAHCNPPKAAVIIDPVADKATETKRFPESKTSHW